MAARRFLALVLMLLLVCASLPAVADWGEDSYVFAIGQFVQATLELRSRIRVYNTYIRTGSDPEAESDWSDECAAVLLTGNTLLNADKDRALAAVQAVYKGDAAGEQSAQDFREYSNQAKSELVIEHYALETAVQEALSDRQLSDEEIEALLAQLLKVQQLVLDRLVA